MFALQLYGLAEAAILTFYAFGLVRHIDQEVASALHDRVGIEIHDCKGTKKEGKYQIIRGISLNSDNHADGLPPIHHFMTAFLMVPSA